MRKPAREEDGVEPASRPPGEHVGSHEIHPVRPHPFAGDVDHLGGGVDGQHAVRVPGQLRGPHTGPAGDLQQVPAWVNVVDHAGDVPSGRLHVSERRDVILGGAPAVVRQLLAQKRLIRHAYQDVRVRCTMDTREFGSLHVFDT